jgi:microcystin-dependent protein
MLWNGNNWVAQPPSQLGFLNKENMQPFLAINYVIATEGIFPSRNGLDPFIAEIMLFAGNFAPRGWAFCDGQLVSIATNTALFSLLGTTYGGDGQTTFALPDLRGRVPLHMGPGPGLTPRVLGEQGGVETH